MQAFNLSKETTHSVEKILRDYDIDLSVAKSKIEFGSFDYDAVMDTISVTIADHPCASPLFSSNIEFTSNIVAARVFLERLNDEEDVCNQLESSIGLNYDRVLALFSILTGSLVVSVFGCKFIDILFDKYGFSYADEMYYAIGAYLANLVGHKDLREVETPIVESNGKLLKNVYKVNIHGDFRLTQYNVTSSRSKNPFVEGEVFPFDTAHEEGSIVAYHSVEMNFLATLLCYAHLENIPLRSVKDTGEFLKGIRENGQAFGNFADAGMYTSNMSKLHFTNIDRKLLPIMPTEFSGYYKPYISGGCLKFALVNEDKSTSKEHFTIYPEMVDDLVQGLFDKVSYGNGRSCVSELEEGLLNYIDSTKKR